MALGEDKELYSKEEVSNNDALQYGTPRHSGRYPWGSGDNAYQHSGDFLSRVDELKKKGMSETEIVRALNLKAQLN